jgi:hypothetical protein
VTDHRRNLAARLTAAVPALTGQVIDELVSRIPAYRLMPREELVSDISGVIEKNLRVIATVLRTGKPPSAQHVEVLRESAARRAEEGIPIEVVLLAYSVGMQLTWDVLTADPGGQDVEDLVASVAHLLRYMEVVTPAVAAGYMSQQRTISGDEQSARQTMLAALLNGEPAQPAADQAGVALPARYLVVAFDFGTHDDENTAKVDPVIAGRRKLRRLRGALEQQVREPVLSSLTVGGGLALLPRPAEAGDRDRIWLDDVVAAMTRAAEVPVTAGAVAATPNEVGAAAASARRVLDVALTFGRPPGVYRLTDVLLEYQLAQPSPARDRLAATLDPLADKPELLDTLATHLRLGDRRAVAARLHVHPNTVDYRLRRVHALTGLDPTSISDVTMIGVALLARGLTAPL